jgi:hypothetical protein
MKPGKELDALVAEKILKLEVMMHTVNGPVAHGYRGGPILLPSFSTDLAEAFKIVELLSGGDGRETFTLTHDANAEDEWTARFGDEFQASGATAAHAITLAALKAVED